MDQFAVHENVSRMNLTITILWMRYNMVTKSQNFIHLPGVRQLPEIEGLQPQCLGASTKMRLKKMSDESNIVQQSLNLHEIVDPI